MDSRALAISLRYEPNTISPVSWGNHRQFAWTVERMVPLAGFSDGQLESLQRRAMEDDPKEWVHRMLIADRVRIVSITEKVSLGLHHNAFLAEYLESIGRLESSLSQSWPEPMHEFRREGMMIRELKDDPKADKRHLLLVGAKHMIDHFGNSMGESIALQRTTAVGLACHRYVVQKRRLPSTIEDVVPFLPGSVDSRQELIIDPCSGQPLQLKPTKGGLHVISVGSNQIDNDGSETVVGWYSQDIVFEDTYPSHQITR